MTTLSDIVKALEEDTRRAIKSNVSYKEAWSLSLCVQAYLLARLALSSGRDDGREEDR